MRLEKIDTSSFISIIQMYGTLHLQRNTVFILSAEIIEMKTRRSYSANFVLNN